ncbi:cryptochrome/photolyase family protein [Marinicella litoralis]|uniref:Deoxyribodipyrimidine photolyase-related protein n=1 Tax=Marinicella litoralis TaxID=644220 RepID=A0A4V3DHR8_9GAMM|nr:cryptochrome/photolyase family protein [Marinicella litoralis]TDR19311.1 deoxyribodipyrimidine photolyase-related protein [Marinicella litoralis]
MKTAHLIFPHQLFKNHPLILAKAECWLIEVDLFLTQYKFHQQKIAFHRASMKSFAETASKQVASLTYIDAHDEYAKLSNLINHLAQSGIQKVITIDTVDDWLEQKLQKACVKNDLQQEILDNPMFLSKPEVIEGFFHADKNKFFHHQFYQQQRRSLNILMENDNNPTGGQWSFDADNRKKYPKSKSPPSIKFPEKSQFHQKAEHYVEQNFSDHLGHLDEKNGHRITYPINHTEAEAWLEDFLNSRFTEFGTYEDAIVKHHLILHHSVLTPVLNVGLITPQLLIDRMLVHAKKHDVPLNSLEGFIRQIIGWREFIRGVYESVGRQQRTQNYWQFKRPIPQSFYTGETGIEPVDLTIKKVLDTGYCHHIERLMVLGNFMLLCEFDPDKVYQWFMELFIDAYDWVMVPNVYGMSQFADGGLMATKPYISSSNYILKMSDYSGGKQAIHWRSIWDGLFWRFMHKQRAFFESNPRIGMLLKTWDRMDQKQQQNHLEQAEKYLSSLS